jgi:CheY-like chemotaxis protein
MHEPGVNHSKPGSGRKLFVIDDDPAFCAFLDDALTDAGYAVQSYTDSDAALKVLCAGEVHPDVVLLDLVMPVRTGRDIITALRAEPALRTIPVVLISALPVPNLGAALGAVTVLRKPFEIGELLNVIARL